VRSLAGVKDISGGGHDSVALASDGTVWAWGWNGYGQLGDGTTTDRIVPVPVGGLAAASALTAGAFHSLALESDGTAWAWGRNGNGQIGDRTGSDRLAPVEVFALAGVTAVAAGRQHSLALASNGRVWAWGWNQDGELGDGTTTDRQAPVQVAFYRPVLITCPALVSLDCMADTSPASTGDATTSGGCGPITTTYADVLTPLCGGARTIDRTFTATDGMTSASCTQTIMATDTTPPTVIDARDPVACLWPPNHRMVRLFAADLRTIIIDECGGDTTWLLSGCASNQPANDRGDGNTEQDCIVAADGSWIDLRAERDGRRAVARHYTLLVTATDECGNTSAPMPAFDVLVPRDASPGRRCR
jgi:hypothetical protein